MRYGKCERCNHYIEEEDRCGWEYWEDDPWHDPCPEDDPYDSHVMPWDVYSMSELL